MAVYPYTVEHNGVWYPAGTNVPVEPPIDEVGEEKVPDAPRTDGVAEPVPAEPPVKTPKKNKKA